MSLHCGEKEWAKLRLKRHGYTKLFRNAIIPKIYNNSFNFHLMGDRK